MKFLIDVVNTCSGGQLLHLTNKLDARVVRFKQDFDIYHLPQIQNIVQQSVARTTVPIGIAKKKKNFTDVKD